MSYIKLTKKTKILNREFLAGTIVQTDHPKKFKGVPCDKQGNELEIKKEKKEENK